MRTRTVSNRRWLLAAAVVFAAFIFVQFAYGDTEEEVVTFGVLSLVTPLLAIVLSFITKQVVLSLATAIFVGATIVNGGNLFEGFLRTCVQL